MEHKKTIGNQGEELAAAHLRKKGYDIRATNWFYKHKEIDIVAVKDQQLIIVEVKTRTSDYFEMPNEMIPRKKQKFLIHAANAYIEKYNLEMETRFDAVFVIYKNGHAKIQHIERAFEPHLL